MAYNLLAEIYISNDKVNEAVHIYEEGTREYPESYLIHYNLGISLMMMKRYEEAVRIFKRAHKLTNDDSALYYNWASAVIGLKNYSEAARLYREGLKLKSDDDEILFGLARVSALSGDVEATLGFLARAFEINPDLRLRAKASHDFAAYRTTPDFMELTKIPAREERKHA
jgi:tetratricopeptide (TPR) repeat protein